MGHTHALTGAAIWLAATPFLLPQSPPEIIAGALLCAGAAMVPDLDHPSGTISQTFGPITAAISKVVNAVSGGHRRATHSLLFAAAVGFGVHALVSVSWTAFQVIVFLLLGLALRALGFHVRRRRITSAVLNALLAAALLSTFAIFEVSYAQAGLAVGLGCLAHTLGDCFTESGCPLLWPIGMRWRMPYKIGIKTGGWFERWVVTTALIVAIVILSYRTLPIQPVVEPPAWLPI